MAISDPLRIFEWTDRLHDNYNNFIFEGVVFNFDRIILIVYLAGDVFKTYFLEKLLL